MSDERDTDKSCAYDDCGGEQEGYMLRDDLWLSAARNDALLCIACFEKRLGRRLIRADFADWPCNVCFSVVPGLLRDRYQPTPDEVREGEKGLLALAKQWL